MNHFGVRFAEDGAKCTERLLHVCEYRIGLMDFVVFHEIIEGIGQVEDIVEEMFTGRVVPLEHIVARIFDAVVAESVLKGKNVEPTMAATCVVGLWVNVCPWFAEVFEGRDGFDVESHGK